MNYPECLAFDGHRLLDAPSSRNLSHFGQCMWKRIPSGVTIETPVTAIASRAPDVHLECS
ncbi:hypothetical protein WI89_29785 [Burkholderia ubonensis]|nr:hypothetical protein WI89_29785 [Burkholderia ubonensis]